MTHFSIQIDIEAPPERVWKVMSDVERWHRWTTSITSIKLLDGRPLAVGSRALVRQPKLPPAKWQVTEFEEGRCFVWVSRGPGFSVVARHAVDGRMGGSRASLSMDYSGAVGWLMARLMRGLIERYISLEANGLKARCENL